jgi:hypothetical protein
MEQSFGKGGLVGYACVYVANAIPSTYFLKEQQTFRSHRKFVQWNTMLKIIREAYVL